MLKKIFSIFIVAIFVFPNFINPITVNAKAGTTLGGLIEELKQLQKEAEENQNQINLTEAQKNSTKKSINKTYQDIEHINDDIANKTKEINQLNKDIDQKDQETKELMRFLQVSNGESLYLEYIMGAQSLTDFIYRVAVIEQLTKYNSDLIDDMNSMIKKNEQKKIELRDKENDLKDKQISLATNLNKLGEKINDLEDYSQSIEEDIKTSQAVINMYKKAGCRLDEDINACVNRMLPPDTSFRRPLIQGYVTSEYGYRNQFIGGSEMTNYNKYPRKIHAALDVSNYDKYNTKIYAVANGKVANIVRSNSGGGNQIIIHHNIINGNSTQKYTSFYCHLSSIDVKVGQTITNRTIIGTMGSTGNSTGPHLHIGISYGHWYKDYYLYNDFIARSVNPRNLINLPSGGNPWYNRERKY